MDTVTATTDLAEKMRIQLGLSPDDAQRAAALAVAVLVTPFASYDAAVEWLLNEQDMDKAHTFRLLAEGAITEEEANTLDRETLAERYEQMLAAAR